MNATAPPCSPRWSAWTTWCCSTGRRRCRCWRALKPDVYAKGGDYTIDTIVQEERRLVEGYGGSIAIIPGVDGHSTTSIIERITEEKG
jgi:bifunctional ADP-heptose synthase (sugar kinase/adenylyltransferase)